MTRIPVTDAISINAAALQWNFVRGSGPGGQNVNKVAAAAQLRFNVRDDPELPDGVKSRLIRLAGRRMTVEGELVIDARRFRTQESNRKDALDRLIGLIRQAAAPPRPRKKTRPTRASKERRLEKKKRQSSLKARRGRVRGEE